MGVFYELMCNQCGALFTHEEGYGLTQTCIVCDTNTADNGGVICPQCQHRTEQDSEEFDKQIQATIFWD
ncbi:MAG: hypothetical protein Q4F45_07400 [Alistipes sp.]|nr:hypothetical protein [Alistipes sp.]